MDVHNDPFPLSLPQFDGPRILGEDMNDAIEEGGLDFASLNFDSPENNLYWDDATSYQSPAKSNGNNASAPRVAMMETSSQSPESSLPDSSSSDSSNNRHKRNHSSDSSQVGALGADGDIRMTGDTPVPNGILIGADPAEDRVNDQPSPATDVDVSNRAMECHFDFDSAASSPSPHSDPTSAFNNSKSMKSTKMTYRTSQNTGFGHGFGPGFGPYSGALKVSIRTRHVQSALKPPSHTTGFVG
ncbi:hypothetical protein OEA41_009188 [Lepraria neglecta]|uniref:Uncharacterized protein n=1 Tax=Lepraria neglecta TaxID=209136 RepID=A0AAD9Z1H2_9LECA|nr:hypothetical protein OEA41_009188 [Lepraria neglecta]